MENWLCVQLFPKRMAWARMPLKRERLAHCCQLPWSLAWVAGMPCCPTPVKREGGETSEPGICTGVASLSWRLKPTFNTQAHTCLPTLLIYSFAHKPSVANLVQIDHRPRATCMYFKFHFLSRQDGLRLASYTPRGTKWLVRPYKA